MSSKDTYDKMSKEEKKEIEKLLKEITEAAKKVVDDYVDNPSEISGSTISIHQNSPFLDSDENNEPEFSGSRWKHVIKKA